MKRIFNSIMIIAAAAMAFMACNAELVDDSTDLAGGTYTVKFVASQDVTKTTMDINEGVASFAWEESDVNYFYIYKNDFTTKAEDAVGAIDQDGSMQITATFDGTSAPTTYLGFFAHTFFNYPQVPAEQTDKGAYDPKADILIAKPVSVEASKSEEVLSMQFKRIVAINIMTLKGLTAGETVSKVKIVSDKPIAGKYDYTKGEWYNSTDMQITVNATSEANADGQAVIYFVSAPVEDAQLTVTATTTEGKTYTKELAKTISFAEGGVKAFGVTVESETPEPVEPTYVKITSAPTDWSGNYLLVYEGEDKNYCWTGVDAGKCHVDVTILNNEIATVPSGAVTLTVAPMDGGYSIMINGGTNDGKFIGKSSYANGIDIKDEAQLNTIEIDGGSVVISGAGVSGVTHVTMRYNNNSGDNNERFRYYKSGQEPVQLYKYTGTPAPEKQSQTLSFPQESYEIDLGETFTAPTVSGAQTTVTYGSNNEEVATVNETTGAVEIIAAGEVTITATAEANDTYKQGTASYTIIITDPSAGALTTIEQIFTSSDESGNYKVVFNNWVVSGVNGSNAYVTDGTNGFIIYKSEHGFEVGDILSGTVNSCALERYKGSAEFTNITATTSGLTVTKGGTITPATVSIANLTGQNTGAVITVSGVTFDGTNLKDASNNSIKPYNSLYKYSLTADGQKYNVTGVYLQYDPTKEILPRSESDIVEVQTTKYTITIGSGIQNGTVTANFEAAAEGATVTLTATPSGTYQFESWSVKDASNNDVTVTGNAFTMPASNVTVNATFKEKEDGGQGGELKTWTYEVVQTSPILSASSTATVEGATWSIAMGEKVGSPAANGTPTKYSGIYGWKWGDSSSKYWKSYTLSTEYFASKKVKSVTVNILNNGSKLGTMTVKQGDTTIGTASATFGTTWTDLSANTTQGTSGTLTIEYTVAQASYIHSITVEYYD